MRFLSHKYLLLVYIFNSGLFLTFLHYFNRYWSLILRNLVAMDYLTGEQFLKFNRNIFLCDCLAHVSRSLPISQYSCVDKIKSWLRELEKTSLTLNKK